MSSSHNPIEALLALGGNLGDVPVTFSRALRLLRERGVHVLAISKLYETRPMGRRGSILETADVPNFINAACWVKTTLTPLELLRASQEVEQACGRTRDELTLSRTLDLDLIDCTLRPPASQVLWLPHPRLHKRRFVLTPLADIAPEWKLGVNDETTSELLFKLPEDPSFSPGYVAPALMKHIRP